MKDKTKKVLQPKLSVVILGYKSGELARSFYQKLVHDLVKVEPAFEIILVGNYNDSRDTTPGIIKDTAAHDPRVIPVVKKKHGMMGWDLRSGLQKASGEYIAFIDGDDQFKPELVSKVYKRIIKTDVDLVKTRRSRRDDGKFRMFISFWFNTIFNFFFDSKHFSDVNSKPKIMKKSAYNQMRLVDNGWFIDAEIMIQAKKLGLTIDEVPVVFQKNKYRKSFVGYNAIIEMAAKLLLYKLDEFKEKICDISNWRQWIYWPKITSAT